MPTHDWTQVPAGIFHHFHLSWISTLGRALNSAVLPESHYAMIEPVTPGFNGDIEAKILPEVTWYARKKSRIAIRHASDDTVVAIVEIVSPGNKGSRHAIRSFVEKAADLLRAGIHLLIIDLFPPTPRDPRGIHAAVWSEIMDDGFTPPEGEPLTLVAYRAADVKQAYIEPTAVGRTLTDMPLFLESGLYVPVPLEQTYQAAFQAVPRRWREELER